MTAGAALLDRLVRVGVSVSLEGDQVCLRPGRLLDPETVAEVRARKSEVIAELRRRSAPPQLSTGGKRCTACGTLAVAFEDGHGGWICWRCVEWRITGCTHFTVLVDADIEVERARGACLSCGASCTLHGNPNPTSWRRVRDLDDVDLVAARYVVATAVAIARGGRQ